MNTQVIAAAILLGLVRADWSGDLSAANDAASKLSGSVDGWSSGDGLQGALGIQNDFPTLSKAVAALADDKVSSDDIKIDDLSSFVSSVTGLLGALTKKASDFNSVGAGSIVGGDISHITDPSGKIVSNIVDAVSADCDKYNSLTGELQSISQAFGSAAKAYSVDAPSFPDVSSCAGGSGGKSSAASGGSGGSSAASASPSGGSGSSEAGSSAASAAPTGKSSGGASAPAGPSGSSSAGGSGSIPISNGGAKTAVGLGAVAGAAALLLI